MFLGGLKELTIGNVLKRDGRTRILLTRRFIGVTNEKKGLVSSVSEEKRHRSKSLLYRRIEVKMRKESINTEGT